MSTIFSLQSHVVQGFVGNRIASFVLQTLGHRVLQINTVQFSSHTGYTKWTGQVNQPEHIKDLVETSDEMGFLSQANAVISGYLGDANLGHELIAALKKIRQYHSNSLYFCDPVIGNARKSCYVRPEVVDFVRDYALTQANIIKLNQFEASTILQTNNAIIPNQEKQSHQSNLEQAKELAKDLYQKMLDPKAVVISSVNMGDEIANLMFDGSNYFLIVTPLIKFSLQPNGCGDLLSSLFLGHYLNSNDLQQAFSAGVNNIHSILQLTNELADREICLVEGRKFIDRLDNQEFYLQKV